MLLEHGVQHQCAAAVAAVADADDDELDARRLDLLPVDVRLIFGDVDAEGGVLPDTVGVEVIELVVDGLDARDRLVGVLVIIVGLAAHGAPAGIDRSRSRGAVIVSFPEQEVPQPAQQAVLVGKTGSINVARIQRTRIQRRTYLFRRQQDGAFLGLHRQGALLFGVRLRLGGLRHCILLHRGAQGVFGGQCLGLLL